MNNSPIFSWFSRALVFVFTFSSILTSATVIPRDNTLVKTLFPNYLVPAHQAEPTEAFDTMFTGDVQYTSVSAGNEIRQFVGFDVPNNGATKCAIAFTLPTRESDPNGYPWTLTGTGKFNVYGLASIIVIGELTWDDKPSRSPATPLFVITQPKAGGKATVVGNPIPCKPGRMDFEMSVARPGPSSIDWFELKNPKAGITLEMYS